MEEHSVILLENARRKLLCKSLKKQIRALWEQLARCTPQQQPPSVAHNFRSPSPTQNTLHGDFIPDPKVDGDAQSSSTDSDFSDSDWEAWCRASTFSKPLWNKSTATKLLSQNPPPSTLHANDSIAGDASSECGTVISVSTSKSLKAASTTSHKIAKYAKEIKRLRELVKSARSKKQRGNRRMNFADAERAQISKIIQVLEDCIAFQEHYDDELYDESTKSWEFSDVLREVDSTEGTRLRKTFLANLESKESLLLRLLSVLSNYQSRISEPAAEESPSSYLGGLDNNGDEFSSKNGREQSVSAAASVTKKLRPSSAPQRSSVPGIKSIRVLLSEIHSPHEPSESSSPSNQRQFSRGTIKSANSNTERVFVQATHDDVYLDSKTKKRPQSAPTGKQPQLCVLGTVEELRVENPPDTASTAVLQSTGETVAKAVSPKRKVVKGTIVPMRSSDANRACVSRMLVGKGFQVKTSIVNVQEQIDGDSPASQITDEEGGSRWRRLSTFCKNPYSNVFPPKTLLRTREFNFPASEKSSTEKSNGKEK
ncbi:hypothetical protein HDU84_002801 [Entophlyctis sp. JEL0112]|nr:hypothetical protein HDU84_002801 [Entophlyctis sp. JEL0112]